MNIRQMLGIKPKTLGEGLNRVKRQFNVKGENLSKVPGTRQYSCHTGNEVLDIRTGGRTFDSCLVMSVNSKTKNQLGENCFGRDLLGKISDITKSYARRHIYKNGSIGTYQEFRVTTETFKQMPNGKIESHPKHIKSDAKVIQPWLFDKISDLYEA